MKITLSVLFTVIALVAVGCGDDDDGGSAGATSGAAGTTSGGVTTSCDSPTQSTCAEYRNVPVNAVDGLKGACTKGVVGTGCPTEGLVGGCENKPTGGITGIAFYYDKQFDGQEATLKSSCEQQGSTWIEP